MILKKLFKTFAFSSIMALTGIQANAQDLIAKQAPVDRRGVNLDTIVINKLQEIENFENPSAMLYDDWSNIKTHSSGSLPETFKIDLRGFHMPSPSRVITSNYGRRWGRAHKGLDIKVYIGDTIRSAFSGKVRIVGYEARGYGKYIVIRHNNGLETYYGHLSKQIVRENQVVKAGQPIGLGGNTGRSTGSHLHFETRLCGVAINPALLFDFANQDVTGDFYTYRRSTIESESARATALRGTSSSPGYSKENIQGRSNTSYNNNYQSTNTDYSARQPQANARANNGQALYHKVSNGDTLESIAEQHGVPVGQICRLNGIGPFTKLVVGHLLRYS